MKTLQELGEAVASVRRELRLKQKAVAEQAGITPESLLRFERGQVSEFGSRKLLAVLAVLGMEVTFVKTGMSGSLDELRRERGGFMKLSVYVLGREVAGSGIGRRFQKRPYLFAEHSRRGLRLTDDACPHGVLGLGRPASSHISDEPAGRLSATGTAGTVRPPSSVPAHWRSYRSWAEIWWAVSK